jgi:hypothetical protein
METSSKHESVPTHKDMLLSFYTESRGRMVNTPALYSGDPSFKSRP